MGEKEMLKEEGRGKRDQERRKQTERVKEGNWERTGELTPKNETKVRRMSLIGLSFKKRKSNKENQDKFKVRRMS